MIELIPAIDIIDGHCVRLKKGDYNTRKTYNENPLEVAKMFEGYGFRRLHVVDLDGAKGNTIVNAAVLEHIATYTHLEIDFGGGIKSDADVERAFSMGAKMVTVGSLAVSAPDTLERWAKKYGPENIILGADVENEVIKTHGWKENGGMRLFDFMEAYRCRRMNHFLCTDIARDGMLGGTSLALYEKILRRYPDIYLIASGGVASIADIEELNRLKVPAVVFGKAIYEGLLSLEELSKLYL